MKLSGVRLAALMRGGAFQDHGLAPARLLEVAYEVQHSCRAAGVDDDPGAVGVDDADGFGHARVDDNGPVEQPPRLQRLGDEVVRVAHCFLPSKGDWSLTPPWRPDTVAVQQFR